MKKPPGFCHMEAGCASEGSPPATPLLGRYWEVAQMGKSPKKPEAKAVRAEKLAKALRANLARRKQLSAEETAEPKPADTGYRRRDDKLAPLGGKSGRRQRRIP